MNVALAREIYGGQPWAIDSQSLTGMLTLLRSFKSDLPLSQSEEKLNSSHLFDVKSATKILTNEYQLSADAKGDDLVYVVLLNGVITKDGGMSSYGMKDLSSSILRYEADSRVLGGVIVIDSGGGSSLGMDYMQYTLNNIRKKPIVSLIERSGMAASAAYGIASQTDFIFSESEKSKVGSIGTMISTGGHVNKSLNGDNEKQVTIYATKSINKNKAFEEAIQNDNYDLIISEVLDPVNEDFIQSVKNRRPNATDNQLDGSMFSAKDVVGSLIDGIGTFTDAVNKVVELSKSKPQNSNTKINSNKKTMKASELKSQHPETYSEIFDAGVKSGVSQENDRVGSWMAHALTDLESVQHGIESGAAISATVREKLIVKSNAATKLQSLHQDSAPAVVAPEATTPKKLTEAEAFYANLGKSK